MRNILLLILNKCESEIEYRKRERQREKDGLERKGYIERKHERAMLLFQYGMNGKVCEKTERERKNERDIKENLRLRERELSYYLKRDIL